MLTGRRLQISLAFGSVYILWGSTFVAIRYVTQLLHPAFVSGLRYMIAGVLSMAYLLLRRRSVALSGREWGQVTLLGLLMFTINTTLVSYGGRVLSAGLTALFVASIPLFLAALEALLPGGSTMNARGWIGTLTGFAGLALLTSHGMRGQPLTSETTLACLALLLAAFAWAVGSVIARRMPMSASPLLLSSWQMLIAGAINMLIGIAAGGMRSSQWTRGAWLAMLYLAIFGSIAGYTSYMFLLRHVRLSAAATYAYINPIVAVLLGWLLLHETLHGVEWVGMGIVIVSVAVVIASKSPAAKPISAVSQT
ncbi:Threonine/homoserine efflux transporter RhtA [Granulicella pectinivorans]|jgi:drug/metabolite transporter (DMT)-like permease|uniref:Threonine/homoserine efflux transporter RhtA n=1 Tax=Granulicella pectinivorans TaxID=474950 RepID=A0A1I6MBQ6_9BACT|nr:EamA family transporter [Granulicella pectinivorans]SFS13047.1 Threonine/homoserine efflux transporter RhtA [Granulicella pectinivorans]